VLFRERLRQAVGRANLHESHLGVLFLDIDDFQRINDGLGHRTGDDLLTSVGGRVQELLRETDTVARLSEDEFAVILPEVEDATSVAIVARKILDSFRTPFRLGGQDVFATASVGVALFPDDAGDIENLLRDADTAMYHAKQAGRNTYQFFSNEMHARAAQHVTLECDLRQAIDKEQLVLHYQPRVDVATGAICGLEALVRWMHPRLGLVPPARFIPLAEQTRLIVPIGDWVLRTACAQARAWVDMGLAPVPVAVNLSAHQFDRKDLARRIGDLLVAHGVFPGQLEIELTESIAMRNPESAIETLHELRAMGVRAAIDDFGTGYSSLSYLKRFPIDALKIDRSFVRDLVVDPDDANIAKAIIDLAHNLRLRVIAEGVETEAQLEVLMGHGCDEVQGYLTGRPMEASGVPSLLARGEARSE
jgi:diguanylate cyclase (GGDEF)-like protein